MEKTKHWHFVIDTVNSKQNQVSEWKKMKGLFKEELKNVTNFADDWVWVIDDLVQYFGSW